MFSDQNEHVWYIDEHSLLSCTAYQKPEFATGLFGTANGVPPWGSQPTALQVVRGRRLLQSAKPLRSEKFALSIDDGTSA